MNNQLSKNYILVLNTLTGNDLQSTAHNMSRTTNEIVIENIDNVSDFQSEDEISPVPAILVTPSAKSGKNQHLNG